MLLFFLFVRIITDNFDIVNMYKCSKSNIFCLFTPNCFFTTNWVKVRDSRRKCKPIYGTIRNAQTPSIATLLIAPIQCWPIQGQLPWQNNMTRSFVTRHKARSPRPGTINLLRPGNLWSSGSIFTNVDWLLRNVAHVNCRSTNRSRPTFVIVSVYGPAPAPGR